MAELIRSQKYAFIFLCFFGFSHALLAKTGSRKGVTPDSYTAMIAEWVMDNDVKSLRGIHRSTILDRVVRVSVDRWETPLRLSIRTHALAVSKLLINEYHVPITGHAIILAAAVGNVDMLAYMFEVNKFDLGSRSLDFYLNRAIEAAATRGQRAARDYVSTMAGKSTGLDFKPTKTLISYEPDVLLEVIAKNNRPTVIEIIKTRNLNLPLTTPDLTSQRPLPYAVEVGADLSIISLLVEHNAFIVEADVAAAIRQGKAGRDIVDYFLTSAHHVIKSPTGEAIRAAVETGNEALIEQLVEKGFAIEADALVAAIRKNKRYLLVRFKGILEAKRRLHDVVTGTTGLYGGVLDAVIEARDMYLLEYAVDHLGLALETEGRRPTSLLARAAQAGWIDAVKFCESRQESLSKTLFDVGSKGWRRTGPALAQAFLGLKNNSIPAHRSEYLQLIDYLIPKTTNLATVYRKVVTQSGTIENASMAATYKVAADRTRTAMGVCSQLQSKSSFD